MKYTNESVVNFYLTDEYVAKHPSIHEEDSPWKIIKVLPLVDLCIEKINKRHITLLDAGGGAGLILSAVSNHIKQRHGREVTKIAVDMSPGMLEVQRKNNPDLRKALNEDIRRTSLGDKEIDIALMIDLLEHVPDPVKALEEAKRISSFVILKVPLEDNLLLGAVNFMKRGKVRQHLIEDAGHINTTAQVNAACLFITCCQQMVYGQIWHFRVVKNPFCLNNLYYRHLCLFTLCQVAL